MYQGKVVSYNKLGAGTVKLLGSAQKVKFTFLNGRRIFAGPNGPEFSGKGILRKPKIGDKVVMLCDTRLTQALLWGYLDSYYRAQGSMESRPIYRYMGQFLRTNGNFYKKAIQIFRGPLNQLNQAFLDTRLALAVHDQVLPKRGQLVLRTFWEMSEDGGTTWKECKDPRKLE